MKGLKCILAVSFFFLVGQGVAQKNNQSDYKHSLGVKFYPQGVTYKNFIRDQKAIEAIGYFWKGTRLCLLYELHHSINGVNGLQWYVGPGAHVAFYDRAYFGGANVLGIDGVLGLDYRIPGTPLNLSLDWQPSFDFSKGSDFNGDWGGLSIRYIFK